MNRFDKWAFRRLKEPSAADFGIELNPFRRLRIGGNEIFFECTDEAKDFLLKEGIDLNIGQTFERSIERFLGTLSIGATNNRHRRLVTVGLTPVSTTSFHQASADIINYYGDMPMKTRKQIHAVGMPLPPAQTAPE